MYIENLVHISGEKCVKIFFSRGGGYAENRRLFKGGFLKNRRLMTMGGGGVKNPEKLMTSFMNAAYYGKRKINGFLIIFS